jgi:hypothetical protein
MKPRRNEEAQAHIGLSSYRKKKVPLYVEQNIFVTCYEQFAVGIKLLIRRDIYGYFAFKQEHKIIQRIMERGTPELE